MRKKHNKSFPVASQHGFTLIEIIAVLLMLGLLAAVAVPKYMTLSEVANNKAIDGGVAQLNSMENLVFAKAHLTENNVTDDYIRGLPDYNTDLGSFYSWDSPPTANGGSLRFKSVVAVLTRTPSTDKRAATWSR